MGEPDRFTSLARELVTLAPAVIACIGRQETAALQAATRTIPIVFMQVNDPVEQGFVVHKRHKRGQNGINGVRVD
jgi:putative tryptophan/tyrosine transport system substrate-binding protein